MTDRHIHLVRTRPLILDVPPLVWIEAPSRPEEVGAPAGAEPPRPHPMAEWLYEGRAPSERQHGPSAPTVALLGAVAALIAGALVLALS